MRRTHQPLSTLVLAAGSVLSGLLLVGLVACSGKNEGAPSFSASTGQHPEGWMKSHYASYIQNPASCRSCHGSTTDPKAAGGVSGVSCFKCHPSPDHPQGWAAGNQHGRKGAQASATPFTGFASCTKCHGETYGQGVGTTPSCKTCHTKAPHPNAPWNGSSAAVSTHYMTAENNAPECAKCHTAGANSSLKPKAAPAAGAAPGCFNNTLCHDRNLGHSATARTFDWSATPNLAAGSR